MITSPRCTLFGDTGNTPLKHGMIYGGASAAESPKNLIGALGTAPEQGKAHGWCSMPRQDVRTDPPLIGQHYCTAYFEYGTSQATADVTS